MRSTPSAKRWVLAVVWAAAFLALMAGCDLNDTADTAADLSAHNSAPQITNDCWFAEPDSQQIECGFYTPADMPGARLAYIILRNNSAQKTEEALVYLPGGPGSSSYLTQEGIQHWLNWYKQSGLTMDLVLLDRRGVGLSAPSWRCSQYNDFSRQILTENVSLLEEMTRGNAVIAECLTAMRNDGFEPQFFSTRQSVDDVAGILNQAGYHQWHLYGVSYGTRLALAVYEFFPERVSSLILDSLYAPEQGRLTDWPEVLNNAFARYWQNCVAYGYCSDSKTIEAHFWQVMKQLKDTPVRIVVPSWYSSQPYDVLVNDQRLLGILFGSLYDRYLYPAIATTINELLRYRTASLTRLVETYVNSAFDPAFNDWVFYSVECRDNPTVSAEAYAAAVNEFDLWQKYTKDLEAVDACRLINPTGQLEPFYKNTNALGEPIVPVVTIPTLLLSGGLDPITPADWTAKNLTYFSKGQWLVLPDYGHAIESSLPCGAEILGHFIADPSLALTVTCVDKPVNAKLVGRQNGEH